MGDRADDTAYQGHTTGSCKLDVYGRIAQPRSVRVVIHPLHLGFRHSLLGWSALNALAND